MVHRDRIYCHGFSGYIRRRRAEVPHPQPRFVYLKVGAPLNAFINR
jgi:hypothetical protein